MAAAVYNFTIEQGASFTRTLTLTDEHGDLIDLAGYTARLQARDSVLLDTTVFELTVANGGIVITPAAGRIVWTRTPAQTAAMAFDAAVYDFEMESPAGVVTRLLRGRVILDMETTR